MKPGIEEEIAMMQRLVDQSAAYAKNENLTPTHKAACAGENEIFKAILKRLKSVKR